MNQPHRHSKFVFATAAACLLITGAVNAGAGLTLVQRESFQGVGTLNSTSPGQLGAVTGTYYKRPVGPQLTTDMSASRYGWSADAQSQLGMYETYTAADLLPASSSNGSGLYCVDFWVYLGNALTDGSNGKALFQLGNSSDELMRVATMASDGLTLVTTPGGKQITIALTQTSYTLPLRGWVNLRVAWQQISKGTYEYNVAVLYRTPGKAWTEICNASDRQIGSALTYFKDGFIQLSDKAVSMGRIGSRAGYSLGAWTDRTTLVADQVDPPAGPFAWYCNPATGSDTNDGTSPSTAWATVGKINAESANLGMLPTTNGYVAGDTLTIDTSTANLLLGPASLNLLTRGLNVTQIGGGRTGTREIQAWTTIPAASWSGPIAGTTHVYQATLTESNPSCMLWENDVWMNHPLGSTVRAVQAALDSTPGSYWTDGTTMYCHSFGDTNPASDGNAYTRSYSRGTFGTSAVQVLAPDMHLNGLRVRKTCLADMNTNDPILGYGIQSNSGAGGTTLIENCYVDYAAKHAFGFTDNAVGRRLTVRNCQAEQGTPFSGYSSFVDFSALGSSLDDQTVYDSCVNNRVSGSVGSLAGNNGTDSWYCHNNGGSDQFSRITFLNCTFGGSVESTNAVTTIEWTGGTMGGGVVGATNAIITGARFTHTPWGMANPSGTLTARNCVQQSTTDAAFNGGLETNVMGTMDYQACTFDPRVFGSASNYEFPLFKRAGALTLTFRNNLFISPPSEKFLVLTNATSTDTLTFDHNLYVPGAYPELFGSYNDGSTTSNRTLAQWQALGKDAGSMVVPDLGLHADDSLAPTSPAIDFGQDLGPLTDYTGVLFPIRNDAGAFEYPLPAIRTAPTGAQVTAGSNAVLTVQVAGDGPFTYQWLRNGVAVPGATGASLALNGVLPGQSGNYSVVVTNAGGSVTSAPATLYVSSPPFAVWQTNHFTAAELQNAAISGPLADPNANGLCNLLEYAFNGDPRGAGGTGVGPASGTLSAADGKHLTITYRQLINAVELAYVVGVSADLISWDESQTQTAMVGLPLATGDGYSEQVTAQVSQPMTPGGRLFLRVKVIDNSTPVALQSRR